MMIPSSKLRRASLLTCAILIAASHVYSQSATGEVASSGPAPDLQPYLPYYLNKGLNEWGVWGGGSFDSPTVLGTAEDRKFLILALRYGRILGGSKRIAYEYTVDAVPLAVVFQPDFVRAFNRHPDHSIYGAGISPIGLKANFNRQGRIKPFVSGSAGFLYFKHPVPFDVPLATRFNFTFDFSGGVQIFTDSRRAVTLGYRWHHISNAYRSGVNPGLDANIFYAGFSLFR
jgi:hypothetical protein